jgi:hypothetical protein
MSRQLHIRGFGVLLAIGTIAAVGMLSARGAPCDLQPELDAVLTRDLHLSPADIVDLERGQIVSRILQPLAPEEFGVVGGVRVQGSRERLVAAYRDIVTFKKSEAVPEVGLFSDPPSGSDLDALTTGRDDFDLRGCRVADCDIRLPAGAIQQIAASVDWKRPDAGARSSALFKQILLANVQAYVSGAPGRIAQYDDGSNPVRPLLANEELIETSPYLDVLKPGLSAHLRCLWSNDLQGAEDLLYWSKEKPGIAPFISVTHVTIVPSGAHQSLATSRDVYSSRYIDASLSTMIASDAVGDPRAFYLVYVNRSRASALRGPMAALRRLIVEHKVKASLDRNLRQVKARIEAF